MKVAMTLKKRADNLGFLYNDIEEFNQLIKTKGDAIFKRMLTVSRAYITKDKTGELELHTDKEEGLRKICDLVGCYQKLNTFSYDILTSINLLQQRLNEASTRMEVIEELEGD